MDGPKRTDPPWRRASSLNAGRANQRNNGRDWNKLGDSSTSPPSCTCTAAEVCRTCRVYRAIGEFYQRLARGDV